MCPKVLRIVSISFADFIIYMFRQQKEQLSNKFDKLEGDSKDKMEEYEAKIYTLEKSHIREQDRLKKEMMERVENVAGEFRKAAHSQMAATTQRTIR